ERQGDDHPDETREGPKCARPRPGAGSHRTCAHACRAHRRARRHPRHRRCRRGGTGSARPDPRRLPARRRRRLA
ncbi:LOW QUALITY PROTEIN: ROK family transcriptional regulator, partial [Streptomyces pristinaespiralis ATCC 25486]